MKSSASEASVLQTPEFCFPGKKLPSYATDHWCVYVGTGYILFDEFCCVVRKKMQDDEDEKELRDMFRILDKEKKGEVNTNELR